MPNYFVRTQGQYVMLNEVIEVLTEAKFLAIGGGTLLGLHIENETDLLDPMDGTKVHISCLWQVSTLRNVVHLYVRMYFCERGWCPSCAIISTFQSEETMDIAISHGEAHFVDKDHGGFYIDGDELDALNRYEQQYSEHNPFNVDQLFADLAKKYYDVQ
jgi:hypothetical protein